MIPHESEQTSTRSFVTRRIGRFLREEKQMNVTSVSCASSALEVRKLQIHIVKVSL